MYTDNGCIMVKHAAPHWMDKLQLKNKDKRKREVDEEDSDATE